MENTNQNNPQGWRDVSISMNLPVDGVLHFLNILNQRLCTIEDIVTIDGQTITELYRQEAEAEQKG